MQSMTYSKSKVLDRLKENRAEHVQIVAEAKVGYKTKVQEAINAEIERLNASDAEPNIGFLADFPQPVDYTEEYDRVIDQLEFSDEKEVVLSDSEFRQYMRNEWGWKELFRASNSHYSISAASMR